jgi:soluble lytic murein transglycosylase-like protein
MNIQRIPITLVFLSMLTFSSSVVQPTVSLEKFRHTKLVEYITSRYNIDYRQAKEIVILAEQHSNKNKFPRVHDTLAIIGIESSYKITAVSKSKAKGLMQVLYTKTSFDPKLNILHGTSLLKEYAKVLPTKDAVVQAYNVGITNFKKGMRNQNYLNKFKQEKERLQDADNVW